MKKLYRTIILLLVLVAIATAPTPFLPEAVPVSAAPPAWEKEYGPPRLYDSGWVLTTVGIQNFEHNLDAAPTLWTILVADNSTGYFPTDSPTRYQKTTGQQYGHLVVDICQNNLKVQWFANGIGYSKGLNKWYQRGTDYARLIIFAALDEEYMGCPYRP